jgi:FKBP-type peptidyl-prolyl cis-trans isomerase
MPAMVATLVVFGVSGCGYADPSASQAGPLAVVPAYTSPGQDQFSDGLDKTPVKFPDGLQYVDLKTGSGVQAKQGDQVQVQYTLFTTDGNKLQSSRGTGSPVQLTLSTGSSGGIPGFVEGVVGMHTGGRRRLVVPPSLGYGAQGQPPQIPPNATLVFIVELVSVTPSK